MPSDFEIYDGLGVWLHERRLARYGTGNPGAAAYAIAKLPQTPDLAVAAHLYGHNDNRGPLEVGLQLRFRAPDRKAVIDLAHELYEALHDQTHLALPGGVQILHVRRSITGPLEEDTNGRWERPDSYRLTLNPKETP